MNDLSNPRGLLENMREGNPEAISGGFLNSFLEKLPKEFLKKF